MLGFHQFVFAPLLITALLFSSVTPAQERPTALFDKSNLAAWCIVPFDAKKRGPEERAAMLEKLGIKQFVYDYRKEHIPTFDEEMEALKRHHIELIGWWFPGILNAEAKNILDVIKRHGMTKCDLWVTGAGNPTATPEEQQKRVADEAARLKPIALEAAKLGVRVGLYNHLNWFGEPENMIAIIEALKLEGITNIGIVYNLHHGHNQLSRLPRLLAAMKPHLICVNLNGMDEQGDLVGKKILPLGQGQLDRRILQLIVECGYTGPIGILNHTDVDAEGRLQDNLDGLNWLVKQMDGKDSGPRPVPRTWSEPAAGKSKTSRAPQPSESVSPDFGKALQGGMILEGKKIYRTLPLTIECRAKLNGASGYNILVASDPKISADHWELYTHAGSGLFSVFLPGRGGEFKSDINICDGQWHALAAVLEPARVRLFVDGKTVHEAGLKPKEGESRAGALAIGALTDGSIGCDGVIDDVRLSGSVRKIGPPDSRPLVRDERTAGIWDFDNLGSAPAIPQFQFDRAPLRPSEFPHSGSWVNRERVYDFYEKEARHFGRMKRLPEVLPQYPGLEGGKFGHWGTQDDLFWSDERWNNTDLGPVISGVFRGAGRTVVKGVCVQLGDRGEFSACFDPTTLTFPVVWQNGFVRFTKARHGFMGGVPLEGSLVQTLQQSVSPGSFTYRGFYRHGSRVIFTYEVNGRKWLDTVWAEDGLLVHHRSPANSHPLRELTQGGPACWPQWIETKGSKGKARPYAIDTLTLPVDNPWRTLFFVTGHDFFPNGDAAICTMTGEVWLCRGIDSSLRRLRWKRYATGLHQPLGLKIVDGKICVTGRDQITRLHDLNHNDEADFYECLSNAQVTSPAGHEFITGLECDAQGRFYFASGKQGVCRVKPGGLLEELATGFRNPNGLGLASDGTLTTAVQEGEWTPSSAICQVTEGGFYGYGGPEPGKTIMPPLVYLPRGTDNSCGGQCFTNSDRWGPLGGQLIHFSPGAANHFLVLREKIDGQWQGAAVPLPGDFLSGVQNGRINPRDGQLYVSGMFGWGVYAPDDGCFQRVRYTGGPAQFPVAIETHDNGVLLTFSEPLDTTAAGNPKKHFAQCWNYSYSAAYGSPEYSPRHPGIAGHDPLAIASAHVLGDGKKLFLEIPQLHPAHTVHLHVSTGRNRTREIFLTAHRLGEPFKEFPGYRVISKNPLPSPALTAALVLPPPAKPNPWREGKEGRPVTLEAALGLQYAQREITASAGERISLTFRNPDAVPHNWVLLLPGTLPGVGDLANKMIADPGALARHYVPESPDVLVYTDMVNAGGNMTIHFDAPAEPGEYPFMCTFPGHWMAMNGKLIVK